MSPRPRLITGPYPPYAPLSGRPNVAVLYVADDGTILTHGGRPTLRRRWRLKFCQRYEVDLHDHLRTVELQTNPLPTQGGTYCFETHLDIGFRVTNPVELLRRNIVDGCESVYQHLSAALRPITRQFPIEKAELAEEEINRRFARDVAVDGGLTIFRCRARLTPDSAARAYLAASTEAVRRKEVIQLEHELAKVTAENEDQVRGISHRGELDRRAEALTRLDARPLDPFQVLLMHLAEHPDGAAAAAELMVRIWERALDRENVRDERAVELMKDLLNRGVVRPADVERFRDEITRRVRDAATPEPPSVPLLRSWDGNSVFPRGGLQAAPDRPPEPGNGSTTPPGNRAWPVYLVVDESPAFSPYLDCVNENLRRLWRELSRNSNLTRTLRLSVLGCAGTTELRLRPDTADGNEPLDLLRGRSGARYGPAFDQLAQLIAADVCALDDDRFDIHPPVVLFVTAGSPDDEPAWRESHRRLLDLARGAPRVIACGVSLVPWRLVAGVATQPADCLAVTGPDVEGELRRFMAVLRASILAGTRAVEAGDRAVDPLDSLDQFAL